MLLGGVGLATLILSSARAYLYRRRGFGLVSLPQLLSIQRPMAAAALRGGDEPGVLEWRGYLLSWRYPSRVDHDTLSSVGASSVFDVSGSGEIEDRSWRFPTVVVATVWRVRCRMRKL